VSLLAREFYAQSALRLAPRLLGKLLRAGDVSVRISETEAYMPHDSACHASRGMTPRNRTMFAQGGVAYVYLCYGVHWMLNVVTGPEGSGQAVLIRAAEPVDGLELMTRRRGDVSGPALLSGPGRLAQALGLGGEHDGTALFRHGALELHDAPEPERILTGRRVGIEGAKPVDQRRLWRFALDSAWVTRRGGLRALRG
jgi:DNA-3-methyladenine glycosylase